MQGARAEGRLKYKKVLGFQNPADALTKYMASPLINRHTETLGMEFRGGRAEAAPELNSITMYTEVTIEKTVRFHPLFGIRQNCAVGKLRQVTKSTSAAWRARGLASTARGTSST